MRNNTKLDTRRPRDNKPRLPEVEETTHSYPKLKEDSARILIFSGVSEIGKNMYGVEYGDEIILIDCGLFFAEASTPGIEYLLPNIRYIKDRKNKLKGVVATYGSLSHLGALAFLSEQLGRPRIFARPFANQIIQRRQRLFRKSELEAYEVKQDETLKISNNISLTFFHVTAEEPSSMGVIVETPAGNIAFTGNIKLAQINGVVDEDIEDARFSIFKEKKIAVTISDSTNSERAGFSVAEESIIEEIKGQIEKHPKRSLVPLLPSQIKRNSRIIEESIKLGKKVYVQGKILNEYLDVAFELGILNIPKEAIFQIEELKDNEQDNVVILTQASENEQYPSLDAMAQKKHRFASINKEDLIIMQSPLLSINSREVQALKDKLSRLGATVSVYDTSDARSGSHIGKEELKWMHQQIKGKNFIPVQGYHYMLTAHGKLLESLHLGESNIIVPENGSAIDLSPEGRLFLNKKLVPSIPTAVDGSSRGEIRDIVIRDRITLSQEGIFIIIILLESKGYKLNKTPSIISRGFIYLHESQDLLSKVRILVKKSVEDSVKDPETNSLDDIKSAVSKDMQKFLLNETSKKPVVIPIIFTV